MLNAGLYSLVERSITTALSGEAQTAIVDLDGMTATTIQARLAWGSGGTTVKVYIQTTIDQGTTWIDIACMAFVNASGVKVVNLSGLTPKTTPIVPTDGAMADDTCLDGILGDRLRAKIVTTGTYANTVLSVRAAVR